MPCKRARNQSETMRRWYWANPERGRLKGRETYAKNKPEYRKTRRRWQKNNPGKVNAACARRHARKLHATPPWLTDEHWVAIERIYTTCPSDCHVDHIVPLQGDNVCGLHVPWNLRHLPWRENLSKRNRLEPENGC